MVARFAAPFLVSLMLGGCATTAPTGDAMPMAAAPVVAEAAEPAPPPSGPPRLILAISVDQLSSDLFAQYRSRFTGGLARLQEGAVFPSSYQSHAATETCPGHSTILTGVRPARNGIVANTWFDLSLTRDKKSVYCAEDVTKVAADPKDYVASAVNLKVPTLGERIKMVSPASRNIAVSGKDRGALMMGGQRIDQVYWWKGSGFTTLQGRELGPAAVAANAEIATEIGQAQPAMALPADCARNDRAITAGSTTVGTGRFERAAGDVLRYRISPSLDAATANLAMKLVDELDLGKGAATDVLSVSLSVTDYVGHATGSEGTEMCIQMHALDATIGALLAHLDARGIDYAAVLTADHGGIDLPERLVQQGMPGAARADAALLPAELGKAIGAKLNIVGKDPLLTADGPFGDFYLSRALTPAQRKAVLGELKKMEAHPQVAAVFTAEELQRAPLPSTSPETWTLLERARASYHKGNSGDAVVLLDRAVVPIPRPAPGYTSTHGSAWDYDRRVPMLFWRRGMTGFEQPSPVETVDIAPTLAALIGLAVPQGEFDGRCLDLDAGPGDSCGGAR